MDGHRNTNGQTVDPTVADIDLDEPVDLEAEARELAELLEISAPPQPPAGVDAALPPVEPPATEVLWDAQPPTPDVPSSAEPAIPPPPPGRTPAADPFDALLADDIGSIEEVLAQVDEQAAHPVPTAAEMPAGPATIDPMNFTAAGRRVGGNPGRNPGHNPGRRKSLRRR